MIDMAGTLANWEAEHKEWVRKHPFLNTFYYPLLRKVDWFKDFPREVKWFIQRGRRGWNQRDTWSMYSHIAKIIPEMIEYGYIPAHSIGATIDPETGEYEYDDDRWNKVLLYIRDGFRAAECISELTRFDGEKWEAGYDFKKEHEIMDHGMDVFKEHFLSLWN